MSDEDDCTDEDKSLLQRVRDCMGGEASGVDERDG
jgi:hypothetical protein